MNIPVEVVQTLNAQTGRIAELVEHVSALEYMLAQAMTVAIKNDKDPEGTLLKLQEAFSEKGAKGYANNLDNAGFKSASRIFTSVKASI